MVRDSSITKLDKFGRRIQKMEDDGTVNMMKEPTAVPASAMQEQSSVYRGTREGFGSDGAVTPDEGAGNEDGDRSPAGAPKSPSLAKLLGKEDGGGSDSTAMTRREDIGGGGGRSVDLKELLPKQKMRFLKLDVSYYRFSFLSPEHCHIYNIVPPLQKFGRRVQMMEDDGTVHMMKEPSTPPRDEDAAMVDLDESTSSSSASTANYGSLKDLLPTKRATWTKLDFKGAPVEDVRRTKKPAAVDHEGIDDNAQSGAGEGVRAGAGLKDLLPKRATWTKLDFKGGSVVDERRTKQMSTSGGGSSSTFNEGQYTNLKTLLPPRTITWKKDQVLSSGSATTVSSNVRGLREERQLAMKNEVVASARNRAALEDDSDNNGEGGDVSNEFEATIASGDALDEDGSSSYTNLKDLLPERKVTWRRSSK